MRRNFLTIATIPLLIFLLPLSVIAQTQDCSDAGSTIDLIDCYHQLIPRVEAEMQSKYEQILNLAAMKENRKLREAFQLSQQTWIAYRKQTCDGIWEFWNPGTAKNTEALWCEVLVDRERTQILDKLYNIPLHH